MQQTIGTEVGFNLIELMIALVIVAVLLIVAMPTYQNHVVGTKRSSGKVELLKARARQ